MSLWVCFKPAFCITLRKTITFCFCYSIKITDMFFSGINLRDELDAISRKEAVGNGLLADVKQWLTDKNKADENALTYFPNTQGVVFDSPTGRQVFETNLVYTEAQVKALCIKFRLRFLQSTLYKGALPYEAVTAIQAFENEFNLPKNEYSIVAPAEFFKLKDRFADPLLFAHLGNGQYYLLHQWGNDFKPYAPVLAYPFRDVKSTAVSAVLIGMLITLLLFISGGIMFPANFFLGIVLGFAATVITSMFVFITGLIYGLVTFNDLSEETWNSPYFN